MERLAPCEPSWCTISSAQINRKWLFLNSNTSISTWGTCRKILEHFPVAMKVCYAHKSVSFHQKGTIMNWATNCFPSNLILVPQCRRVSLTAQQRKVDQMRVPWGELQQLILVLKNFRFRVPVYFRDFDLYWYNINLNVFSDRFQLFLKVHFDAWILNQFLRSSYRHGLFRGKR